MPSFGLPSLRHPVSVGFGANSRKHLCSDGLWLVSMVRWQEFPSGRERLSKGWASCLCTQDGTSGQWMHSQVAGAGDKELGGAQAELCPRDSRPVDQGGPLSSRGATKRSERRVNEKPPTRPLEPFSLLPLSWSPQTWGGRPRDRGKRETPRLASSGCLGSSPSLGPHYCPGKLITDTHGTHELTRPHRAQKSC